MDEAAEPDFHGLLHRGFRWRVPARFNIGQACGRRWGRRTPQAVAIRWEHEDGRAGWIRYGELQRDADRLAHALRGLGVARGDRVAIVMPQRVETAVAHLAVYQLGAVAMPLSMLFGPDALEYRLRDSAAVVALADETSIANLLAARPACPALRQVVAVGAARGSGDADYEALLARARGDACDPVATRADDPAVLIYTSGTTGPPKGALIPHRALIGNLTGFVCSQDWFPYTADGSPAVFWSPADWAWTGGLVGALLPVLYFGREIVAFQG
ncbi:MAG TPA: AMP-binding protein, partial [Rubrivivax sp.]|nr:AMP-binding protein [Rubrivivax sp.]